MVQLAVEFDLPFSFDPDSPAVTEAQVRETILSGLKLLIQENMEDLGSCKYVINGTHDIELTQSRASLWLSSCWALLQDISSKGVEIRMALAQGPKDPNNKKDVARQEALELLSQFMGGTALLVTGSWNHVLDPSVRKIATGAGWRIEGNVEQGESPWKDSPPIFPKDKPISVTNIVVSYTPGPRLTQLVAMVYGAMASEPDLDFGISTSEFHVRFDSHGESHGHISRGELLDELRSSLHRGGKYYGLLIFDPNEEYDHLCSNLSLGRIEGKAHMHYIFVPRTKIEDYPLPWGWRRFDFDGGLRVPLNELALETVLCLTLISCTSSHKSRVELRQLWSELDIPLETFEEAFSLLVSAGYIFHRDAPFLQSNPDVILKELQSHPRLDQLLSHLKKLIFGQGPSVLSQLLWEYFGSSLQKMGKTISGSEEPILIWWDRNRFLKSDHGQLPAWMPAHGKQLITMVERLWIPDTAFTATAEVTAHATTDILRALATSWKMRNGAETVKVAKEMFVWKGSGPESELLPIVALLFLTLVNGGKGRFAEALQYCANGRRRAEALSLSNLSGYFNFVRWNLLFLDGRYTIVLQETNGENTGPLERSSSLYMRARVLMELGRYDQAREALEKTIEDHGIWTTAAKLLIARMNIRGGRLVQMQDEFEPRLNSVEASGLRIQQALGQGALKKAENELSNLKDLWEGKGGLPGPDHISSFEITEELCSLSEPGYFHYSQAYINFLQALVLEAQGQFEMAYDCLFEASRHQRLVYKSELFQQLCIKAATLSQKLENKSGEYRTWLGLALKSIRDRSSTIDDPQHKRDFLQKNSGNAQIIAAAKEVHLL